MNFKQLLTDIVKEISNDYSLPLSEFTFNTNKDKSISLNFASLLCLKYSEKNGLKIMVKEKSLSQTEHFQFLDSISIKKNASMGEFVEIHIDLDRISFVEEALPAFIHSVILTAIEGYKSNVSFDCCSRYLECSDQKKCVQPNSLYYMSCTYRSKLNKNIIYFGENRNVT